MTGRRVAAALLLTVVALGSGGVPMMGTTLRVYWQLKQYIWKKELDDRDVVRVVGSLDHEHPEVVCCAITVIVAHRRLDLLPAVKKTAAARKDVAGDVARTAVAVLGQKPRRLAVPFAEKARGASHSVKIALRDAAVLLEVRERRMGLQPALKEASLDLERHQRTLLEYSKMKEAEAVRVLVSRIQSLKVTPKGTYAGVLSSYGDAGAAAALQRLEAGKGLSTYGTITLMSALAPLAFTVDAKTRARIDRVLAKLAGSNEERVANRAKSVRKLIASVEGEGILTPAVDANAIHGDFIAALKERKWSDPGGFEKCVLRPQTIAYTKDRLTRRLKEPDRWRAFRKWLPALRRDTYDSFWAENQQAKPVAPKGEIPMQVHVLTEAECAELEAIRDSDRVREYWGIFRSRYGKAVAVSLGAPGVSRDGKQALIYCVAWWDKKAAWGSLFLLVHKGGHWEVADEYTVWMS